MNKNSQLTNTEVASSIAQLLHLKADIPKPFTLEELLEKVKPSLVRMLKNGHTYLDVVLVLADFEIVTTANVIEAYHTGAKKGKGSKRKSKNKAEDNQILIEQEKVDAIAIELKKREAIRIGLTLSELVIQLKEPIEKMLAAHYSYSDIAEALGLNGIKISPATLKKYYQGKKRQKEKAEEGENQSLLTSHQSSLGSDLLTLTLNSEQLTVNGKPLMTDEQSLMSQEEKPESDKLQSKHLSQPSRDREKELEKEFNL